MFHTYGIRIRERTCHYKSLFISLCGVVETWRLVSNHTNMQLMASPKQIALRYQQISCVIGNFKKVYKDIHCERLDYIRDNCF